MMLTLSTRTFGFTLVAGLLSLSLASGQDPESAPPEKARALLDQVKRSELDRQIAVEQKEIDRLVEDQARTQRDSAGLQKTIESTTALLTDSDEVLRNLNEESRRLDHEIKVAEARSGAERLKIEGLRALNSAQEKSLSALARHAEETEARARVHTAELELLQAGKAVPNDGKEEAQSDLAKARKALTVAEGKTVAEDRAARDAMKEAAAKMSLAETQAAKAQRLADNDLTAMPAVAEKPKTKSADKPSEKKESASSTRQAQSVKPPAPVAAPPATATTTADPARKAPKPFVPIFKR